MIYFIGNKQQNVVKIGYSNNVQKRKATLQTAYPYKLDILFLLKGGLKREKYLHGVFEDHNITGEWFYIEGVVKTFIESKGETIIGKDTTFTLRKNNEEVLKYSIVKIEKEAVDIELDEKYHSPENIKKAILHYKSLEVQFKKQLSETE